MIFSKKQVLAMDRISKRMKVSLECVIDRVSSLRDLASQIKNGEVIPNLYEVVKEKLS